MAITSAIASSLIGAGGSLASSALSSIGNYFGSQASSIRASREAKILMAIQDQYQRKFTHDQYGIMRQGLEDAGYNPLLALGSSTSYSQPSASSPATDSDTGQQMSSSAIDAFNSYTSAKSQLAQANLANSNSALAVEQAKTEQSKRINYDFQNAMLDVQKHLADKDLSTYDQRFYSNLYEQFQRAENYRASSAIGMMNAETNRMNAVNSYELGKYNNETNRMNAHTNSKNARINDYNAETNRGKRSFSGFGFSASFTPRNYNNGGYIMN